MEQPINTDGQVCPSSLQSSSTPAGAGVAAPTGLVWQRVYGVVMPFSASAGPAAVDASGVASGFAHSPQGAVTAAMHLVLRSVMAPKPTTRGAVIKAGFVVPAGQLDKDVEIAQRPAATVSDDVKYAYGIPAAVRVTTYQPDFTHVQWAGGPSDDGSFVLVEADMAWSGGDWKLVYTAAPAGDGTAVTTLPTSQGWTLWMA